MNWMMIWDGLNVAARLGVALIVIIKLTRYPMEYRKWERLGLGVAGGCALMTVPVIVFGPGSPFDDWAGAMFALGVFVYFAGRVSRHMRHERGNRTMVRQAKAMRR